MKKRERPRKNNNIQNMRILLISDHADPLTEIGSKEAGGQNIYVLYLSYFLSRLGVFVDVYTRSDSKDKHEVVKINDFFRVIRVKAGPKRYIPRDNFLELVDEFTINIMRRIEREKIQYNIIFSNYWFSAKIALKIAKKIKLPIVHVYHSIGKIRFESLKKLGLLKNDLDVFQERMKTELEIAMNCARIISTSPVEKKIIENIFNIDPDKICVIPIGVDVDLFHPIKNKSLIKIDDRIDTATFNKCILYVGRFERRKGIGTLLFAFNEILRKYPSSILIIIGGGKGKDQKEMDVEELKHYCRIVDELNINEKVKFLGPKKQKTLIKYYNIADVVVVPSYYEPFGIVPLESMACGTPVVASNIGGLKYTVRNGATGLLALPRNYKDLAEKIIKVLDNGKSCYLNKCIKRIESNFTWKKISRKVLELFESVSANVK